MRSDLPDFTALARSLPCDEGILAELGRATWAALDLHRRVHDLTDEVRGAASEWPVNLSLPGVVRELEAVAERHARRRPASGDDRELSQRDLLLGWCQGVGGAAARSYEGVVEQIVHGVRDDDRVRYGAEHLVEVTGRLVNAARTLPTSTGGA